MLLDPRSLEWFLRGHENQVARYPLTDLYVDKDNNLHIDVAIAGFKRENIEIELKGNQLHIIGIKTDFSNNPDNTYIQKHISSSDFKRIMVLHENYVGGEISANIEDGILSIKVIPKEPTRKLITIS